MVVKVISWNKLTVIDRNAKIHQRLAGQTYKNAMNYLDNMKNADDEKYITLLKLR